MTDGFSFCGINIKTIGLNYVPENKDTYVYKPGKANVHEETFEGHNGGYYYGAYTDPKEFILRCYYQEEHIAQGLMAYVHNLFKVGKSGLLIFDQRPWCYYYATVTDINTDDMYNYLNGLLVITMKAYYPFARGVEIEGRMFSNRPGDPYHDEIMANTGLVDDDAMVPPMSFSTVITSSSTVLLFNPGTERAKVNLVMAGKAEDGITIYNRTTDQECKYVAFDTTSGDTEGGSVKTDGFNGKTVFEKDNIKQLAFLYHDHGFIELEPAFPIMRNLEISYNGGTIISTDPLYSEEEASNQDPCKSVIGDMNKRKDWYAGKYIYINGWYKIDRCLDEYTLIIFPRNSNVLPVQAEYPGTGTALATIALLNEIVITPTQEALLSKIDFVYKPTYS